MRSRWLRLLPLFFAAFWLPVQAIAATAMPFCRHGEAHRAMPAVVAVGAEAGMEHCALHGAPAPADHGLNCDDCGFCHLSGASFLTAVGQAPAARPASRDFQAWPELAPASIILEPPRYPPKRTI
jgi:hypothetical protein